MMNQNRRKKIEQKCLRLEISETLRNMIRVMKTRNLRETQVGNFIYRASGEIRVGMEWFPVTVHVKSYDEGIRLAVFSPQAGLSVISQLDVQKFKEKLGKAERRLLN